MRCMSAPYTYYTLYISISRCMYVYNKQQNGQHTNTVFSIIFPWGYAGIFGAGSNAPGNCMDGYHKCVQEQPWPKGFGDVLQLPFPTLSDGERLLYGRLLWNKKDKDLESPSTGGYVRHQEKRCSTEWIDHRPIGEVQQPFSRALWTEAQQWCNDSPECHGIMLYIGFQLNPCISFCGRPQFCTDLGDAELEDNPDWDLWLPLNDTRNVACDDDGACRASNP
eukprot:GEMP01037704.1.p1 GENE.GEMP01037704.1~~GEMP01037704.1.p1  ORF type:complete len:222 (+),score=29.83 GEMP01037704.1:51-716(+)